MEPTVGSAAPPPPDAVVAPHATLRRPTSRALRWSIAGAAVAGCAYLALVDPNRDGAPYPGCPFRALTGLDCPGCGITRALRALVTGHPLRAFDHNALVMTIAVVALAWWLVSAFRRRTGRPALRAPAGRWVPWVFGAVVVAFWVARNLPWSPFTWLASGASGA